MTRFTPIAVKVLLALLILAGAGRTLSEPQQTLASKQYRPLDLAALALTPEDLEDAGLEGYGSDYGKLQGPEDYAAEWASEDGTSLKQALDFLEDAKMVRAYSLPLALPIDGGSFEDVATAGVIVSIIEFESKSAAEAVLNIGERGLDEGDREIVARHQRVGDDSFMSRSNEDDRATGDRMEELTLEFYTGSLYVVIDVYDVARDGEPSRPEQPSVSLLEEIGERQLERIESAWEENLPSLSNQALRLTDDDGSVVTVIDRYTATAGAPHRRYAETDEDLEDRAGWIAEDRTAAIYHVEQDVYSGSVKNPSDPHLILRLYQFEDADAATEWMDETAFNRFAVEWNLEEIEHIDLPFDLGETSFGAKYTVEWQDTDLIGTVVWVQIDDVVARVALDAADPIDLDVVEKIVEAQADCLRGGPCNAMEVTNELT